jgi:NTP pyrophosphatase (non-canonical NTP hydrolase)
MHFSEYQARAKQTAIYPEDNKVMYPTLGLAGEAGEIANKVKKIFRDDQGVVTDARRQDLSDEIGDVLWYVAALATDLGLDLDDVARANVAKLASRQERGTLGGEGDSR